MAHSSSIQKEEAVKPVPGYQDKPHGILSGRKFAHLLISFFHILLSIVSKIHHLTLSFFRKPPLDEHDQSKEYPLSKRVRNLSQSSDSDEVDSSEITVSTSSDSDDDSSESITPFSNWNAKDWELVIGVLKNMMERLKEKPEKVDGSKFDQAELRMFRAMHDKLERVLDRMPPDNQEDPIVKEFITGYKKLIERKIVPSLAETVYEFIYNYFISKPSPEVFPRQSSSPVSMVSSRTLSSPRPHTTRGSPPRTPSPIERSPERAPSVTPPGERVETQRLNRRSLTPDQSPRVNLGGIPQLGNSCYLNAVMQVINEDHLPLLTRLPEDKTADYKKREQLDQARHLLMQVKDDPTASPDEVWLAAIVLRNLLFDLGIVHQADIGDLGYFGQQDAFVCASGLLQAAPLVIREVYKVDNSNSPLYIRPEKEEPAMKEPLIRLPMGPDTSTIQALLNSKFALRKVTGEGITHRTFPKTLFSEAVLLGGVYEQCSDSPDSVVVPVESFQIMERIEAQELPVFVCVQLSRFENDGSRTGKNTAAIQWPKNGVLDFNEAFKIPANYKLTGAVLHEGSLSGGHYTAYATRDNGASWRHYNDNHVGDPIEAEDGNIPKQVLEEIEKNGYLFYLEKVDPVPVSDNKS